MPSSATLQLSLRILLRLRLDLRSGVTLGVIDAVGQLGRLATK